jgi:hypothetical protein
MSSFLTGKSSLGSSGYSGNVGYGSVGPGYENPLDKGAPSWSGSWDWKGSGGSMDWSKPKFSVADEDEEDWGSRFSKLFDKTRRTDKYLSESKRPYGGEWSRGLGGNILENLGVYEPQKMSPLVIPGQEGKKGLFGQAGGLAGALGTAAGIFGPLGMPIGAAVGGLIDTARG